MLLTSRRLCRRLPASSSIAWKPRVAVSRCLCSSGSSKEDEKHQNKKSGGNTTSSFIEKWKPYSMKIGVGSAACLTLYGLSSFMWDITYNVMTMSPASGMYYGFVSGVGTAALTAASLYYVRTATKVDANEILYMSRRQLNANEDLRSLLGGYIYVGDLAAFRHTYGSFKVAGFLPRWNPPKIELIFNVYSGKNEGIATIEATQNGLYGQIRFLGVDVQNASVTRVLVEGDASGFETHDALKSLVQFKSQTDPEIRGHD